MKESLSTQLLKGKLPRFLQQCAQIFETDRRYRIDKRYIRVWIQLEILDYVDNPRALLKTMEANKIRRKLPLSFQIFGLYYEKLKKFEDAEKMYRLGVQK